MPLATPEDGTRVGEIIGEAFTTDPVSRWTMGSDRAIRALFALLAKELYLPWGHCCLLEDKAATMWLWPNQTKDLSLWIQLRLALILRDGVSLKYLFRALAVDAAMAHRRPREPHMYLFTVGVLPQDRGQGLGGRIIRESLQHADRMGLPSYLENSNPANTGLYQRLGFVARETFEPAPGCPPMTTMLRPPQSETIHGL